jgi:hypothetical protein
VCTRDSDCFRHPDCIWQDGLLIWSLIDFLLTIDAFQDEISALEAQGLVIVAALEADSRSSAELQV